MWETVKANSSILIFSSTAGYLSACLLLLLHLKLVSLGHVPLNPIRGFLSLINVFAGLGAIVSGRPNIGTMLGLWGLLSYLGIVTMVAAPLGLLNKSQRSGKIFSFATFMIIATGLIVSLGWIVFVWLSALLAYYQPYLGIGLFIVIIATAWLALRVKNGMALGLALFLVLTLEATSIFILANVFLVLFVGLALNP